MVSQEIIRKSKNNRTGKRIVSGLGIQKLKKITGYRIKSGNRADILAGRLKYIYK